VVDVPEQDAVQGQSFLPENGDRVLRVDRQMGEDRHARGEGGAGGGPVDALVEVGHAAAAADADLDDAGEAAGVADADGDLVDELPHEVVDVGAGEVRQRGVAADEAGAGDDVDAGLRRQRLVVVDVAAVADAGGVDEGAAAVLVERAQLRDGLLVPLLGGLPPLRVQLGAGHPGAGALVDGNGPQFLGRDRPQDGVHSRHSTHLRIKKPDGRSGGRSARRSHRQQGARVRFEDPPRVLLADAARRQQGDERGEDVAVGQVVAGVAISHYGGAGGKQDPAGMDLTDQLGDEVGAFGVREVVLVLGADVVEGDVGAAAGDLQGGSGGDGVPAVESADDDAVGGQPLVEDDVKVVQGVGAVPDGDRDTGGERGAGGAAEEALVGGGHARAGRRGGHQSGRAPAFHTGDDHALGDLPGEQVGELLGRPGRGRVGLRGEEVAAEEFLRALAGRGDDVHAGRPGEGLVEPDVTAVEHAGAVDDGAAAVDAEVVQLRGEHLEDLGAVEGDVEGVLRAGDHGQQGLVDGDDAQPIGRHRAQDGVDGGALDAHGCLT